MAHYSTSKKSISVFERNEKIAERHHDKGLDHCYVHHDYNKALVELRKAIALREALFGKYHNDTALSYFRISSVLVEEMKQFFDALVVSRREFRISQSILGDSEFSTMSSEEEWLVERKKWMIKVLQMDGSTEADAIKYCKQLLQAIEFERLGDGHCKAKEWDLAITQYNCALALESTAHARNKVDMADLHVKIGDCLVKAKDHEAALQEFAIAEALYKEELGSSHTYVAIVFNKTGAVHLKERDYDAALAAHSKAYSIYEEYFGKEHEICVEALKDIRLVAVKEIEDLRQQERQKLREEKRGSKAYNPSSSISSKDRRPARNTL